MTPPLQDGGERDPSESVSGATKWDQAGRRAVAYEVDEERHQADIAYRRVVEKLHDGEDPTLEEVTELRHKLDELMRATEEFLVPIAGGKQWDEEEILSYLPQGVARQRVLGEEYEHDPK
ncbi:hypothetical protein ACFQE1_04360 [Halobium palmae]|uniref:Uncharacterized protein n=1 Tax=Halobium palmae TaxID=1776492 RepID=A0ABD5RWL8_9EURY